VNSANFVFTEFYEVRLWEASGYSHLPNTTNATPTTTAATNAAIDVATNTNAFLACLGQALQSVFVLDDDTPILELDSPALLELAEGTGDRDPLAADHRG
jgi:hypothetical protein